MRIILSPFGSHGDVHPFIGLAHELRKRGHEPIFLASANFGPLIKGLGFEVVPLGDLEVFDSLVKNPDLWHPRKSFPLVAQGVAIATRLVYQHIESLVIPGETVAIGGTLAMGVRIAGEKLGIPTVTVHLQPSILHSNVQTPVYPGLGFTRWWPTWLRKAFYEAIYEKVLDPHLAPHLNGLRGELGLPPDRRIMMAGIHRSPLVLGFFPSWFGPPQPDWPPNVQLLGFPLYDERDASPMPEDLDRFLAEGSAPIAFTPGSANIHGRAFFEAAAEACVILGKRGLLLTRYAEQIPTPLPDGVRHVSYAPFGLLLPRTAALVHHGGIGTAAQAMTSAIPQLLMPLAHDQFDNADRMIRLGIARKVAPKQFQGERVAKELNALLDSAKTGQACRDVANKFIDDPEPNQHAADLVEQLARHWNDMKQQRV